LLSGAVLVGNGSSAIQNTKLAPSGDFVGVTDSQTLTNKTFSDKANFTTTLNPFNFGTPTQYVIATVAPSAQRTLNVKDMGGNSDFLFPNGAQSLTNKTINSTTNTVTLTALKTVNVSSAAAPSASQALQATSGTAATWQNPTYASATTSLWTLIADYTEPTPGLDPDSFSPTSGTGLGSLTIPANTLKPGSKIIVQFNGTVNVLTSMQYSVFAITLGGSTVARMTSTAQTTFGTTGVNNFSGEVQIVFYDGGASTTLLPASGQMIFSKNPSTARANMSLVPSPIPTIDTTIAQTLQFNITRTGGANSTTVFQTLNILLIQP
jgi:hypothetical protein